MKRLSSRIFAFVLAFMMCLVLMPVGVKAEGTDTMAPAAPDLSNLEVVKQIFGTEAPVEVWCYEYTWQRMKNPNTFVEPHAPQKEYELNISNDALQFKQDGNSATITINMNVYVEMFNRDTGVTHHLINPRNLYNKDGKTSTVNLKYDGTQWKAEKPSGWGYFEIDVSAVDAPELTLNDLKTLNVGVKITDKTAKHATKNYYLKDLPEVKEQDIYILTPQLMEDNQIETYIIFDSLEIFEDKYNKDTDVNHMFLPSVGEVNGGDIQFVYSDGKWQIKPREYDNNEPNLYDITAYCEGPAVPTDTELAKLLKGQITVECQTNNDHDSMDYSLIKGSYTIGDLNVGENNGKAVYSCTVTLKKSPYVDKYSDYTDVTHELTSEELASGPDSGKSMYVYLDYDSTAKAWKLSSVSSDIKIKVQCNTAVTNMYRLYNPNSGEHFYTASLSERKGLVALGWRYEGVGWTAPVKSKTPVYRLYNKNGGEHHYTTSVKERDHLVSLGWKYEKIGWYSDDNKSVPVYRQYNPNAFANNHNYTADVKEKNKLIKLGWHDEKIGWYGVETDD